MSQIPLHETNREIYYTQGRYLYDRLGNKVILRGANKMSVWEAQDDSEGQISFPEIRKTGANSVRIVWAITENLLPMDLLPRLMFLMP